MQIEIARPERMSESGSSLLRLIQNNDTCRLDLLVREAVQNCLDAGDGFSKNVHVDFNTGSFKTENISEYFDGISEKLNMKFPGYRDFIAVRDTNTTGLTGPVRYDDIKNENHGNFLKLVYEISKPQDNAGSGGSWGLGKTVYFRIGIGLVIYYSRIKKENSVHNYESRLAATLVEDETKEDCLLPRKGNIPRGIAWWGDDDPENEGRTIPITDDKKIEEILIAFGIHPFRGNETGTMIIIPFISEKELLAETISDEIDEGNDGWNYQNVPYWCTKLNDYLKIAVQRWYAPRLQNTEYKGQFLDFYINDEQLTFDKMAPIFQLIQKLYNTEPEENKEFNGKEIISKKVDIRSSLKKSRAGKINYIKVDASDMKMNPPDNLPSPFCFINRTKSSDYNDPIITFTRKPGMIVSYSTSGDWTDSIPKTGVEEYLIGIFVVNSDNQLIQKDMTLEEYIRKGEKADHMSWDDWTLAGKNPQIIAKIKKNVRKKIKDDYGKDIKGTEETRNLGLGKTLADLIMPPADYEYWDDAQGGTGGPGGTGGSGISPESRDSETVKHSSHVRIKNEPAVFGPEGVELPIKIFLGKKNGVVFEMAVDSESRKDIYSSEWEESLNSPFPIKIKSFQVINATGGKGSKTYQILKKSEIVTSELKKSELSITLEKSEKYNICKSINISSEIVDNVIIEGILIYELHDVKGKIVLKEEF